MSSLPFLYASLVSVLVSIAALPLVNLPILLAKNTDGTFPIWSIIIFSPYLYFVRGFSALRRWFSREDPYSEICDGLYVGGWPSSPDKLPPGNPAIIDCTCELPRRSEFLRNAYLCIPTWDTRSPQPADIEMAVKWACQKREQRRPVFVHCAYGMPMPSPLLPKHVLLVSVYVFVLKCFCFLFAYLLGTVDSCKLCFMKFYHPHTDVCR